MTDASYVETYRRSLLDMHIPDWEPAFLARFDPRALAEAYASAGIEGALIYCKSHVGLANWPTPVGGVHRAAAERDLVAETIAAMRERGIAPALYHSVIFDNWAALAHPDWRVVNAQSFGDPAVGAGTGTHGARYGVLCPNNPEYRDYEIAQLTALVRRYDAGALWVDMVFWPCICVCRHCQRRALHDLGSPIPTVVDWTSPTWLGFVRARVKWLDEFWHAILSAVRSARPGMPVLHNFGVVDRDWYIGVGPDQHADDDFVGGDLYGGRDQQLIVSKLMHTVSRRRPAEYMSSRSPSLKYHVQVRSERELLVLALGAVAQHLAFLFIDAVNPDGTIEKPVYERIGRVFEVTRAYETFLGGSPVEDVAVYYSQPARITLDEQGRSLSSISKLSGRRSDHGAAFAGACAALQASHIAFGVLTRPQLPRLADFAVLVLPDVTLLDEEEVEAIRGFVAGGGRLYASGGTSLRDGATGRQLDDFALADVFGVHREADYEGSVVFAKPSADDLMAAIHPERFLSWGVTSRQAVDTDPTVVRALGIPLLKPRHGAQALATTVLPYGYPAPGSMTGSDFASIHSSPPWLETERPAITRHRYGSGEAIYSAAPLETAPDPSSRAVFGSLVEGLLPRRRVWAHGPARLWVTAFDQLDRARMIVSLLNHDDEPDTSVTAAVAVRAPEGYVPAEAALTTGGPVPHTVEDDVVRFAPRDVAVFEQIVVTLRPRG